MLFRKAEAGALIGRKGENINELCDQAGCEYKVQKEDEAAPEGMGIIYIEASDERQFDKAVQLLISCPKLTLLKSSEGKVLKESQGYSDMPREGNPSAGPPGGRRGGNVTGDTSMEEFWVPDRYVGLCIGNKGLAMTNLENATGTRCTVHKFCPPGRKERCIEIHGPPAGIAEAKARLSRVIDEVLQKPVKLVKDDYDFQDVQVLAKIRNLINYDDL